MEIVDPVLWSNCLCLLRHSLLIFKRAELCTCPCHLQGGEFSGEKKSDAHERRRLVQLVHLQAREIEGLRDEIGLLSRKGGHILPPTAGGGPRGAGGGGGGGGGGPGAGEGSVGFMGGGVGYVGGPSPPPPSLPPVIPGTHQHRTHAQP